MALRRKMIVIGVTLLSQMRNGQVRIQRMLRPPMGLIWCADSIKQPDV